MTNESTTSSGKQGRRAAVKPRSQPKSITKKKTGIAGFDDITGGGLPDNRVTAVIGGPGAGKTVFAMQTLVNRFAAFGEQGIFVTFEEPLESIQLNMRSFEWPIDWDHQAGIWFIDARIPIAAVIAGSFDLIGLLTGLGALVAETGAVNVVFDGIDMLLSGLPDARMERQELARLDEWVRELHLTALVTVKEFGPAERDQLRSNTLQYLTDCVFVVESRVADTTSSRNMRIIKYRGSGFAANPVPVLLTRRGFDVVAFKTSRLNYPACTDRVSSGITRLDALLCGGYLRGSGVLISGSPGTSKTSLSASFVAAACARGEVAMFISFDESTTQIVSNMRSIGLELAPYIDAGILKIVSLLSRGQSPEEHYVRICDLLEEHTPTCIVVDPLSSLLRAGYPFSEMISECLIDYAKSRGVTILCTSLLDEVSGQQELSASKISTIADTWMHVTYVAHEGERNRALTIVKSRGTGHSNQVRELVLGAGGVDLVDVYVAEGQVLMGSARAQMDAAAESRRLHEKAAYDHAQVALEHEIGALKASVAAVTGELDFKTKERLALVAAEGARAARELSTTAERLGLRRADDDVPVKQPAAGKRRKVR